MNCGMKVIKYLLFSFNLIFFVFAIALVGVGAAVEIKYRSLVDFTGNALSASPILLICIGVFIFFVSFFGCCGAYKESYCMVSTFAVLMGLIFILEIAAAIAAYVLRGKVDMYLSESFKKSIVGYTPNSAEAFDFIQKEFQCCGAVNSSDWANSPAFQAAVNITQLNITDAAPYSVPDSCCQVITENCGLVASRKLNDKGCVPTIEELFKANIVVVGGVALGVIFVQLVGFIFSCILMSAIRKQYEVV